MIDHIKLNRIPAKSICGIYFLYQGEELIYIGKSTDIYGRIAEHKRKKRKFTSYSFTEVNKGQLSKIEEECIKYYKPKFNRVYNPNRLEHYQNNFTNPIVERGISTIGKLSNMRISIDLDMKVNILCNKKFYMSAIYRNPKFPSNYLFTNLKGNLTKSAFDNNVFYGRIFLDDKFYFITHERKQIYKLTPV